MLARMLSSLILRRRATPGRPSANDRERLLVEARNRIDSNDAKGAEEILRGIIRDDERDSEAYRLLGAALGVTGRADEARVILERARSLDPENASGLVLLGNAYRFTERLSDAERCYQHALEIDPFNRTAGFGLACVYETQGRSEAAQDGYIALLKPPAFIPALKALVGLLLRVGKVEEAKRACADVLQCEPEQGAVHALLGFVLLNRELEAGKALEHFERALQAGNCDEFVLTSRDIARGLRCQDLGQLDSAITNYDAALQRQPQNPLARFHRALVHLLRGEFGNGWPGYEARLISETSVAAPRQLPRWEGESLPATTLLVYGEQGIGDEIMFASCLPDLLRRCPKVVLTCASKLEPILKRSFPQIDVMCSDSAREEQAKVLLGRAAVMSPIGSLPLYLRPTLAHFPQHNGYLRADPGLMALYRERLAALGPEPKVGISWRGGTVQSRKALRSIDSSQVAMILDAPGIRFVNLQYDSNGEEPEIAEAVRSGRLLHWSDALDDYDRTAALVSCLHVVVSVCTAIIHLAGALNRPAWVMAPVIPEWRYGMLGERMPWYPSVEIIRQRTRGDWIPVVQAVRTRLQALGG